MPFAAGLGKPLRLGAIDSSPQPVLPTPRSSSRVANVRGSSTPRAMSITKMKTGGAVALSWLKIANRSEQRTEVHDVGRVGKVDGARQGDDLKQLAPEAFVYVGIKIDRGRCRCHGPSAYRAGRAGAHPLFRSAPPGASIYGAYWVNGGAKGAMGKPPPPMVSGALLSTICSNGKMRLMSRSQAPCVF